MGMLEDILKALDRTPRWKRLQEVPSEVDELKSRVSALEGKLDGKWPADICKFCGARAVRMAHSLTDEKGIIRELWDCAECQKSNWHYHKVSAES
jgi:hypothetical protein